MRFCGDGREGDFGKGLGDADDGFELADGDGDGGAGVGGDFGAVDLAADGDEVGGEFFGGFGGEAGGAASALGLDILHHRIFRLKKWKAAYDLQ